MDISKELPMGFGMALARNTEAMERFSNMTKDEQQKIIDKTHSVSSKKEMQQLVRDIINS